MNTDVDLIVHINNVTSAPILSKQGLDTLVSPPHDINTLADIRAAGGISSDLAESMPDEAEGLAVLEAHAYLEPISSDIPTREALINQGYADSVDIASRPRDSFVAEMEGAGIDNQVVATIHARAVATERIVNNIITGRRVELANGFEGAEPLDIPELDPPPCECRKTISAVSPLAYLTDLLNYVMKHVTRGEGKDASVQTSTMINGSFRMPSFPKGSWPSAGVNCHGVIFALTVFQSREGLVKLVAEYRNHA